MLPRPRDAHLSRSPLHESLGRPDVEVTSQKDKDTQLPKLEDLGKKVVDAYKKNGDMVSSME